MRTAILIAAPILGICAATRSVTIAAEKSRAKLFPRCRLQKT
jgi:hypothetical protein